MKSSYFRSVGLVACLLILSNTAFGQARKITKRVREANTTHQAAVSKAEAPTSPATSTTSTPVTPGTATSTSAKPDPIQDLPTAEKVVKYQLNAVKQAKGRDLAAQKNKEALHASFQNRTQDKNSAAILDRADKAAEKTAKDLDVSKQAFDKLYEKYQKFGGTNDYRAQLPQ